MIKPNHKKLKIKTAEGYKNFSGVQKLRKESLSIKTDNFSLSCSLNHPICVNFEEQLFENVDNIQLTDFIYTVNGYEQIREKHNIGVIDVYDVLDVEDTNSYFTNGILSHNCEFLDNSESSLDEALFDKLKNDCKSPLHILKDGKYKIWEEYDPEKIYVIGGDVSEGVGLDASVLEVLDITNPNEIIQVAEYHNNMIGPSEFTNEVVEICGHWGNPLLLIERNNQGTGVCDTLANTHMYQNLVSWGAKEAHKNKQNGMISHINTKYKAVLNQRYFVNEAQSVVFRNLDTLKEFKVFVRYPNGSWKAKSGEHDDRVMAFVWALMALYKDITELYFEVEALDDCDKPLVIKPIDQGLHQYRSSTSIYTNEEVDKIEHSNISPMLFGGFGGAAASDMAELEAAGWELPDHSVFSNPERNINPDQWAAMEKYFG
jgi:hypothetical protein